MDAFMNCQYRPLVRTIALVLSCFGACAACGVTQAPPEPAQLTAGPSYTSSNGNAGPRFPNVDLAFELRGPTNSIIPRPEDLSLHSLGQQIATANAIRRFDQTGYGVTAILAIDARVFVKAESPDDIHAAIAKFVSQARPQDKLAVLTFADGSRIDSPFGASPASTAHAVQMGEARGEVTRLYDDILDALNLFTNSQPKRRQLLVLSDGHDEGSHHTIIEAILKAESLGVVIDSIGLTEDHGEPLASLRQLSFETGGTYLRAQSARELQALIGQNIESRRATPVATFVLDHVAADGKLLSTQLRWKHEGLSTTAFIQTPKGKAASGFPPNLSSLWLWGLGGCFVAGVLLLALSWGGTQTLAVPSLPTPQPLPDPTSVRGPVALPDSFRAAAVQVPAAVETSRAVSHAGIEPGSRDNTESAALFKAPAGGPFARLLIQNGSLAGQRIPITTTEFSIGGVQGNNLLIPGDTTISGQHLRLHWNNSMLHVEDNNSTNGTYLNRQRLTRGRHLLRPGDMIGLGQTLVLIERA